jgi:integrase
MAKGAIGAEAPTAVNSSVRIREYLTVREVERLMAMARQSGRYGPRDATMILIAFRHGLRAVELCDLMWHQVELATGRLHVRRVKSGSPSVHPMQGDEIRALRRLQRESGPSPHVFTSERGLATQVVSRASLVGGGSPCHRGHSKSFRRLSPLVRWSTHRQGRKTETP